MPVFFLNLITKSFLLLVVQGEPIQLLSKSLHVSTVRPQANQFTAQMQTVTQRPGTKPGSSWRWRQLISTLDNLIVKNRVRGTMCPVDQTEDTACCAGGRRSVAAWVRVNRPRRPRAQDPDTVVRTCPLPSSCSLKSLHEALLTPYPSLPAKGQGVIYSITCHRTFDAAL